MNYRCPKCQSTKLMPVASASAARPIIPKSLLALVPSVFLLVITVLIQLILLLLGKSAGTVLNGLTLLSVVSCILSAILFWRVLPDFKISMQRFMQTQKHWKCRDCNHQWQNH